jgi:radical SAM protein with 4Fe4S-binding SPASM domain
MGYIYVNITLFSFFGGDFLIFEPSKLRSPLSVYWECTYRCNLSCSHCYSTEDAIPDELTTAQAKNIIAQCAEHHVLTLGIGGGEPLMRNDLTELMREAREYGLNVFMVSNGHLITSQIAHELARNKIHVSVSLDGAYSSTHDRLRGPGSFKKTLIGLNHLAEAGVSYHLLFTVFKWNVKELDTLIEKTHDFKADSVVVNRPIALGRGEKLKDAYLTPVEYKTLITNIASWRSQGLPVSVDENLYPLYCLVDEHFQGVCPAGQTLCVITASGCIKPCPGLPQLTGESVLDHDFEALWRTSTALCSIRDIAAELIACRSCQFFSACNGGCRAAAMAAYHSLYAPDPDCWIYKQEGVEPHETI